jgi:hypothetical protein
MMMRRRNALVLAGASLLPSLPTRSSARLPEGALNVQSRRNGAKGDGAADDTKALNEALLLGYQTGQSVILPAGIYRITDTLLNLGTSMFGEGRHTVIAPSPEMPRYASVIKYQPRPKADLPFLSISRITIIPGHFGPPRGAHAIELDFLAEGVLAAKLLIQDCFLLPSNGFSIFSNNDGNVNPNGNPYISSISRNVCHSGMKLTGAGDSIVISENYIAGGETGIDVSQVAGKLGPASHVIVARNNGAASGGFFRIRSGLNLKFVDNNIEQYAGPGSNAAVVDIDGSENSHPDGLRVPMASIKGNKIGVYGDTSVTAAVRINNSIGAIIDENQFLAGKSYPQAILISSLAVRTTIGDHNIFSAPDKPSHWVNRWTDNGINSIVPAYSLSHTTPIAGSGAFASADCTLAVRRLAAEYIVDGEVRITRNGTAGEYILIPLPFSAPRSVVFAAREMAKTGKILVGIVTPGGGKGLYIYGDYGSYPGGDGYVISFSGRIPNSSTE